MSKEHGQLTYEAWHRARLGIPDEVNAITWEDTKPRLKAAWAAAEESARDAEQAAVINYLYDELGDEADQLAVDIAMGRHREVATQRAEPCPDTCGNECTSKGGTEPCERTGCSCFHAPEQHGRMGCSMMGRKLAPWSWPSPRMKKAWAHQEQVIRDLERAAVLRSLKGIIDDEAYQFIEAGKHRESEDER